LRIIGIGFPSDFDVTFNLGAGHLESTLALGQATTPQHKSATWRKQRYFSKDRDCWNFSVPIGLANGESKVLKLYRMIGKEVVFVGEKLFMCDLVRFGPARFERKPEQETTVRLWWPAAA
jgi:hypothetical protein